MRSRPRRTDGRENEVEVDVCIVGAGFAGLSTAWRLRQAGLPVLVLEARERVEADMDRGSGRRSCGGPRVRVWFAPKHEAAFRCPANRRVHVQDVVAGRSTCSWVRGRTRRHTGLIPEISPQAVLRIGLLQLSVDRLARQLPPMPHGRPGEPSSGMLACRRMAGARSH